MMAKGATPANTCSPDSARLKEVGKLFGQLFALLFAIIQFDLVKTLLLKALAFMVTAYYMVLMVATWYEVHVPLMMVTSPFLGAVVAFIALVIISPTVAFISLGLLIFIFALKVLHDKYLKEIYEMIPENIKYLFERPHGNQNVESSAPDLELGGVMSVHGK